MQLAKEQGDFLLVGLHTDDDVMERRGAHLPIMDLHERSLSVLACRYVNEVIIGGWRTVYTHRTDSESFCFQPYEWCSCLQPSEWCHALRMTGHLDVPLGLRSCVLC